MIAQTFQIARLVIVVACVLLMMKQSSHGQSETPREARLIRAWSGDDWFAGSRLTSLSISRDSHWAAWCSELGSSGLIDLSTGRLQQAWSHSPQRAKVIFLAAPDEALVQLRVEGKLQSEIWNVREHKRLRPFPNLSNNIAVSDDGLTIVSQHDHEVRWYDLASGETLGVLKLPYEPKEIRRLLLIPKMRRLAVVPHYSSCCVWDFDTQQLVWQDKDDRASIANIGVSHDGKTVGIARIGTRVDLFDTETGKMKFSVPCQFPSNFQFSADDGLLWCICMRQLLCVDMAQQRVVRTVEVLKSEAPNFQFFTIEQAALAPDDRSIVIADDQRLWQWDLQTFQPKYPLKTMRGYGAVAGFSPRGDRVFCSDKFSEWEERDTVSGEVLATHRIEPTGPPVYPKPSEHRVLQFFIYPANDVVVVHLRSPTTGYGRLDFWNDRTKQLSGQAHVGYNSQWSFNDDGKLLSGTMQSVTPFDLKTYFMKFEAQTGRMMHQEVSRVGEVFKVTKDGGTISAQQQESELRIRINGRYACVPFVGSVRAEPMIFPDDRTIGMTSVDGFVLWDVKACEELRRIKQSGAWIMSTDGQRIAVATPDFNVHVYETATGTEIAKLSGHRSPINSRCFSPDGKQFVTGTLDGTLRHWDLGK